MLLQSALSVSQGRRLQLSWVLTLLLGVRENGPTLIHFVRHRTPPRKLKIKKADFRKK